MNHIPKVSVIIPVYGVEKYIERCARSLFEQTLDDIEYLFINDCTKDDSIGVLMRTLENYPHRKPQMRVITMEQNSGQAAVRKRGMLEAQGEYQIHCDSDDWVETDMYEKMYLKAKETDADIVTCNFWMEQVEGISEMCENIDAPDPHYHINYIEKNVWWTLWARLIRTSLILECNLFPHPGMNMWEDIFVNLRVYYYANRVTHITQPFYHYNFSRDGSIVEKCVEENIIQQQILCIKHLEKFFSEVDFDANSFLNYRKAAIKSKYLNKESIDYKGFYRCFPECGKCVLPGNSIYKFCWELAAKGIYLPFKLYNFVKRLRK